MQFYTWDIKNYRKEDGRRGRKATKLGICGAFYAGLYDEMIGSKLGSISSRQNTTRNVEF